MGYKTDIEIAREAKKLPIQEIGAKLGIGTDDLLPYGHDKAKVSQSFINSVQDREDGKLNRELMPDGLHPNEEGYRAWAKAMDPTIQKFLGEE